MLMPIKCVYGREQGEKVKYRPCLDCCNICQFEKKMLEKHFLFGNNVLFVTNLDELADFL